MKTFIVPITWRVTTELHIEANTPEEAAQLVWNMTTIPEGRYVDDSLHVISEEIKEDQN